MGWWDWRYRLNWRVYYKNKIKTHLLLRSLGQPSIDWEFKCQTNDKKLFPLISICSQLSFVGGAFNENKKSIHFNYNYLEVNEGKDTKSNFSIFWYHEIVDKRWIERNKQKFNSFLSWLCFYIDPRRLNCHFVEKKAWRSMAPATACHLHNGKVVN